MLNCGAVGLITGLKPPVYSVCQSNSIFCHFENGVLFLIADQAPCKMQAPEYFANCPMFTL